MCKLLLGGAGFILNQIHLILLLSVGPAAFCEMQGRENTEMDLLDNTFQKLSWGLL